MCRIALLGDSYISRLERFCDGNLKIPGHVKFFGKGGMRTPSDFLDGLLAFQADVVFLSLGGNHIQYNSTPKEIISRILSIRETLITNGVKTVFIAEISERGCFTKSPQLTAKAFNAQRQKSTKN